MFSSSTITLLAGFVLIACLAWFIWNQYNTINTMHLNIQRKNAEIDALKHQIEMRYSPAAELTPELYATLMTHSMPAPNDSDSDTAGSDAGQPVTAEEATVKDAAADFEMVHQPEPEQEPEPEPPVPDETVENVIVLDTPVIIQSETVVQQEPEQEPEQEPDVVMNVTVPSSGSKKRSGKANRRLVL